MTVTAVTDRRRGRSRSAGSVAVAAGRQRAVRQAICQDPGMMEPALPDRHYRRLRAAGAMAIAAARWWAA